MFSLRTLPAHFPSCCRDIQPFSVQFGEFSVARESDSFLCVSLCCSCLSPHGCAQAGAVGWCELRLWCADPAGCGCPGWQCPDLPLCTIGRLLVAVGSTASSWENSGYPRSELVFKILLACFLWPCILFVPLSFDFFFLAGGGWRVYFLFAFSSLPLFYCVLLTAFCLCTCCLTESVECKLLDTRDKLHQRPSE